MIKNVTLWPVKQFKIGPMGNLLLTIIMLYLDLKKEFEHNEPNSFFEESYMTKRIH